MFNIIQLQQMKSYITRLVKISAPVPVGVSHQLELAGETKSITLPLEPRATKESRRTPETRNALREKHKSASPRRELPVIQTRLEQVPRVQSPLMIAIINQKSVGGCVPFHAEALERLAWRCHVWDTKISRVWEGSECPSREVSASRQRPGGCGERGQCKSGQCERIDKFITTIKKQHARIYRILKTQPKREYQ
jgi:hypothetical protein